MACCNAGSLTHWGNSEVKPTSSQTLRWVLNTLNYKYLLYLSFAICISPRATIFTFYDEKSLCHTSLYRKIMCLVSIILSIWEAQKWIKFQYFIVLRQFALLNCETMNVNITLMWITDSQQSHFFLMIVFSKNYVKCKNAQSVAFCFFVFFCFVLFFSYFFSPLYSMGIKLFLHVYIIFPHPLFCCNMSI